MVNPLSRNTSFEEKRRQRRIAASRKGGSAVRLTDEQRADDFYGIVATSKTARVIVVAVPDPAFVLMVKEAGKAGFQRCGTFESRDLLSFRLFNLPFRPEWDFVRDVSEMPQSPALCVLAPPAVTQQE